MPFLTRGKTNWKYILIVTVLAAIVGGGVLFYLGYFEKEITSLTKFPEIKKPEKLKIEEGITNWKTYRNEEYGFEIKYPKVGILGLKLILLHMKQELSWLFIL
jgi:membrane protein YqaA with SNARE-associated domain